MTPKNILFAGLSAAMITMLGAPPTMAAPG